MLAIPLLESAAREHPAFVHVPLGLVAVLPVALFLSFRRSASQVWIRTAFFLAALALAGSLVAAASGLLWARQLGLVRPGGWLPEAPSNAQALQRLLQLHELAALSGVMIGAICLWRLALVWRASGPGLPSPDSEDRRLAGRRFWERGAGISTLLLSLAWLGAWGFCGRLGGIMVFGDAETNRAAAEAESRRKNDAEAELPLRALDYASLEPVQAAPFRSASHGGRWVRAWVPASSIDAYKAGHPLPPGGYAVLSSVEDLKGQPGPDPGPLYFKEVLSDGRVAFAFYWPRVPEARRTETGGDDFVYWRSPDPHLDACAACHRDAGPAGRPGAPRPSPPR